MTAAGSQITILIPDPDEMMFVAGDNEANIDRIEREFGVKIVSRGAELRISGEADLVRARSVAAQACARAPHR